MNKAEIARSLETARENRAGARIEMNEAKANRDDEQFTYAARRFDRWTAECVRLLGL